MITCITSGEQHIESLCISHRRNHHQQFCREVERGQNIIIVNIGVRELNHRHWVLETKLEYVFHWNILE